MSLRAVEERWDKWSWKPCSIAVMASALLTPPPPLREWHQDEKCSYDQIWKQLKINENLMHTGANSRKGNGADLVLLTSLQYFLYPRSCLCTRMGSHHVNDEITLQISSTGHCSCITPKCTLRHIQYSRLSVSRTNGARIFIYTVHVQVKYLFFVFSGTYHVFYTPLEQTLQRLWKWLLRLLYKKWHFKKMMV